MKSAEVKSPCVEVCQLDAGLGTCVGCLRTLDEIARWSGMDDAERKAVLAALPARRVASRSAKRSLRR